MSGTKIVGLFTLLVASFLIGRMFEAKIRIHEEGLNIMKAYRDGKSKCDKALEEM